MQDQLNSIENKTTPSIELVAVTKYFDKTLALQNIDLEIEHGEFLVLLGPSGCGKSTLLRIIAGLQDATEGEVYINNRLVNYVAPKERDVAMVFQNYALYPHMTVERNIGFPLKMNRVSKIETHERVVEVARLLELDELLARYPEQLSGGQRQRVALGRALIRDPIAFLLDEPLSNLDALLRVQMRDELLKLHRTIGRTTLYVTHDQVEAMTMADRIVVLKLGIIQQVGSPADVYMRPANTFVATFVGSPQMNLISGELSSSNAGIEFNGAFNLPLGKRFTIPDKSPAVQVGIRPENIAVVSEDGPNILSGIVVMKELVGADIFLNFETDDDVALKVRVPGSFHVQEGEQVLIEINADSAHLFDAEGLRIETVRE